MIFLHEGDCLDKLEQMTAESVDSVVTDPPYHLTSIVKRFGADGAAPAKTPEGGTGAYARASRGFMGQTWDGGDVAFRPETWAAVGRVMKPGAHLVAFGGTRTYHRMACAIEDAGFEIRDCLGWLYGTGFPKSHDVAKGIDKLRPEDPEIREVCRHIRAAMDSAGLRSADLVEHFGGCHPRLIDHWAARDTDSQPSVPTPSQWHTLRFVLGLSDSMTETVMRLNAAKGEFGESWHAREITGSVDEWRDRSNYALTSRDGLRRDNAASDDARAWQGWGTALKPAFEPIVLARKPLAEKSVARQVLATSTGAINVDGCRVPSSGGKRREGEDRRYADRGATNFAAKPGPRGGDPAGRFPANIVHDGSPEVLEVFPDSGGQRGAITGEEPGTRNVVCYGDGSQRKPAVPRGDSGSAARFFYCAKASKADRRGSDHPTVKPHALMRWLVRLVTPPGGIVLDPFAGTGSTAWAAHAEGFESIAIEREPKFAADIRRLIDDLSNQEEGNSHE